MQRQSRYPERSGAMTREKRGLDQVDAEERQQDGKRSKVPALARFASMLGSPIMSLSFNFHLLSILTCDFLVGTLLFSE